MIAVLVVVGALGGALLLYRHWHGNWPWEDYR